MNPTIYHYKTSLFNALIRDGMALGSEKFNTAVNDYYQQLYVETNQQALTSIKGEDISVLIYDMHTDPLPYIVDLLNHKQVKEAIHYLTIMVEHYPNNAVLAYNLGLAYSENRQYSLSVQYLNQAIKVDADYVNAWVGLGVSYTYLKRVDDAKKALHQAITMDPGNGYAHRNLGALFSIEDRHSEAFQHFEEAIHQLPNDPETLYGTADCLNELGRAEEADELFKKIIQENPASHLSNLAKEKRTQFAQNNFKKNSNLSIRYDVMMYILEALKTFKKVGKAKAKDIAFEVAVVGADGLEINNPDKTYSLRHLPGTFTGLHLLAIMYTGFQAIDPSIDVGADFKEEYKAAKSLMAISD